MAREKYRTLTEQMFYALLCFYNESCGTDVMRETRKITKGSVCIGSGTLYNLIEQFLDAGLIYETKVEGRKKLYQVTEKGKQSLECECIRLKKQLDDYNSLIAENTESIVQKTTPEEKVTTSQNRSVTKLKPKQGFSIV